MESQYWLFHKWAVLGVSKKLRKFSATMRPNRNIGRKSETRTYQLTKKGADWPLFLNSRVAIAD
jgi:hypothetical protein